MNDSLISVYCHFLFSTPNHPCCSAVPFLLVSARAPSLSLYCRTIVPGTEALTSPPSRLHSMLSFIAPQTLSGGRSPQTSRTSPLFVPLNSSRQDTLGAPLYSKKVGLKKDALLSCEMGRKGGAPHSLHMALWIRDSCFGLENFPPSRC
jgi:hypothetical protein